MQIRLTFVCLMSVGPHTVALPGTKGQEGGECTSADFAAIAAGVQSDSGAVPRLISLLRCRHCRQPPILEVVRHPRFSPTPLTHFLNRRLMVALLLRTALAPPEIPPTGDAKPNFPGRRLPW